MCVHDGNALINSGCDSNMTPSSELALIVSPIKIDSSFSVKKKIPDQYLTVGQDS